MDRKEFSKDEKPRNIFVYVCERIAESLREHGFKYIKSNNAIIKRDSQFTYKISFQPSIKYGSTSFLVNISVESDCLAQWRRNEYQGEAIDGMVVATSLARLTKMKNEWPRYEIATFTERERVILEITNIINDYAIPFFEQFNDINLLVKKVEKFGFLPHLKNQNIIFRRNTISDFIRCFSSSESEPFE